MSLRNGLKVGKCSREAVTKTGRTTRTSSLLSNSGHVRRARRPLTVSGNNSLNCTPALPLRAQRPRQQTPPPPAYYKQVSQRYFSSTTAYFSTANTNMAYTEPLNHRAMPVERLTDNTMEKPLLDDRTYRVVRLTNQLEVLLIHDPDTDKASAALDVNVGSFSDADDMPGMAHAVEHLLFMGTEKVSLYSRPSRSFSILIVCSSTLKKTRTTSTSPPTPVPPTPTPRPPLPTTTSKWLHLLLQAVAKHPQQ